MAYTTYESTSDLHTKFISLKADFNQKIEYRDDAKTAWNFAIAQSGGLNTMLETISGIERYESLLDAFHTAQHKAVLAYDQMQAAENSWVKRL